MKIYTNLDDCKNDSVIKMSLTTDRKYLGIRTSSGVVFLRVNSEGNTLSIIDNFNEVPEELLNFLKLKIDLVSTDEPQIFTRER